jgi:hypothetical protein
MGKEEDSRLALEEVEEDARDHLQTVLQVVQELRQARAEVVRLQDEVGHLEQEHDHRERRLSALEAEVAGLRQDQQKVLVYKQRIKQYKVDIEGYRQELDDLHERLAANGGPSAPKRLPQEPSSDEEGPRGPRRLPPPARAPRKAVAPAAVGAKRRKTASRSPSGDRSDSRSEDDQVAMYDERRSRSRSGGSRNLKRSRSGSQEPRGPRTPAWKREAAGGPPPVRPPAPPSRTVGVFGLNPSVTQDDLRDVFEEFGKVRSIQLVTNRGGKRPYCFIEYETLEDAMEAKEKVHETRILGDPVRTDFAIGKYRKDTY